MYFITTEVKGLFFLILDFYNLLNNTDVSINTNVDRKLGSTPSRVSGN